jgi:hypothetical protein
MSSDGYGLDKNIEDMLVAELKEILSEQGLSTVGKKLELVSRLKDHLNENPLKRKAEDAEVDVEGSEDNEESHKKQKLEHEETQGEGEENNEGEGEGEGEGETEQGEGEEIETIEYQEEGVQGEYQDNEQGNEGQEQFEGKSDEEVEVEEVGAGRELYPEEKEEEQEEKERNEESQSQDGNDSAAKDASGNGLSKIPTLPVDGPNKYVRQPSLRDQVKVAMGDKNLEELDKLTQILLSQNEQSKVKIIRLQRQNEDFSRTMQIQAANFGREKFFLQQIARERDELKMRLSGVRPGQSAPMARPPQGFPINKNVVAVPQPARVIPPTGQRYGQLPPISRPPPTTGYAQQTQQQSVNPSANYSRGPAYTSSYHNQQQSTGAHHQQQQQYQNHQQSQGYSQSYQQRKY